LKAIQLRAFHPPTFAFYLPVVQWFNGDGVVSAFEIKDGHVDFKQAYVRTEKYVKEAEARRALLGTYLHWKIVRAKFKVLTFC
jgi:carotenoid cleavage dioxygenase